MARSCIGCYLVLAPMLPIGCCIVVVVSLLTVGRDTTSLCTCVEQGMDIIQQARKWCVQSRCRSFDSICTGLMGYNVKGRTSDVLLHDAARRNVFGPAGTRHCLPSRHQQHHPANQEATRTIIRTMSKLQLGTSHLHDSGEVDGASLADTA